MDGIKLLRRSGTGKQLSMDRVPSTASPDGPEGCALGRFSPRSMRRNLTLPPIEGLKRMLRPGTLAVASVLLVTPHFVESQSSITAEALRTRLTAFAHDSMMGRAAGTKGDYMASAYVEHEFRTLGLLPGGENGTFFQTVPLVRESVDTGSVLFASDAKLRAVTDFLPAFWLESTLGTLDNVPTVFGGTVADSSTWITASQARGKIVVFRPAPGGPRPIGRMLANPRFAEAVAIIVVQPSLTALAASTMGLTRLAEQPPENDQTTPPPADRR